MITTDVLDRDELLRQLEPVQIKDFKRPAVPLVFAEYERFLLTGKYPYLDEVVTEIATRYRVAEEVWAPYQKFHHQAAHDLMRSTGNDLIVKLHHEVYLASGQHRALEMAAEEARLAADGWLPITVLEPATGMKIRLANDVVYRLARADGTVWDDTGAGHWTAGGDWVLLAPRKRVSGISLNELVRKHKAFEQAKAAEQTSMISPAVVMFKPVARR